MTDYKIDRAGADCELGDVPWERSHPELYGTADDYYDALSVLEKRGISPKHRCMLLAHLNAPNHTVTWENLAKACGYASYRSVNLRTALSASPTRRRTRSRGGTPSRGMAEGLVGLCPR